MIKEAYNLTGQEHNNLQLDLLCTELEIKNFTASF